MKQVARFVLWAGILTLGACGVDDEEGITDESIIGFEYEPSTEESALRAAKGGGRKSGSTAVPTCTDPQAWPAAWVSYEDEVLALVNRERAAGATCGTTPMPPVPPLADNLQLRIASRCHSLDMAVNDYFSHTARDGDSPWARIQQAGYTGAATGENIAAGYASAASVVAGWMSSPGHCLNIMSASSNETGIGYAFSTRGTYGHYWTETFGRR